MKTLSDITAMLKKRSQLVDSRIEKYLPREFSKDSLLFKINPPKYQLDLDALNQAVANPFWEFLDRGGKRWRPALFILVCEALGGNSDEFLDFAIIPEIIHNGSLIADDVEDSSSLRRGKSCVHKLFGLDIALNLSNVMYFLPMLALKKNSYRISTKKSEKIYEIYIQEMVNISFGQATDIAWHKGFKPAYQVTEDQYLQMCAYKTGTLAKMAAEMAAVLAGADDNTIFKMGKFAESIGIAFQIQDDVLDLVGKKFARGKGGIGKDITEGKLTLMVIHALRKAHPLEKKHLLEILVKHTREEELIMKAINIIGKQGSIEYAKGFAVEMVQENWEELDNLLSPSDAKEDLRILTEYLVKRNI